VTGCEQQWEQSTVSSVAPEIGVEQVAVEIEQFRASSILEPATGCE
jgi:hypothetical protein